MSYGIAGTIAQSMDFDSDRGTFVVMPGRSCRVYFHCATEGKKLDVMRKNPRVCMEVEGIVEPVHGERPCDWSVDYESVIIRGQIREVTEAEEKRAGLEFVMRHQGAAEPFNFAPTMLVRTAVLRMDICELTGKSSFGGKDRA